MHANQSFFWGAGELHDGGTAVDELIGLVRADNPVQAARLPSAWSASDNRVQAAPPIGLLRTGHTRRNGANLYTIQVSTPIPELKVKQTIVCGIFGKEPESQPRIRPKKDPTPKGAG